MSSSLPADRRATTLGLLSVNHEHAESYLRGYLPFLYHCLLRLGSNDPIPAKSIQGALREHFGIELPLGVVRSLLREATDEGKVREDHGLWFRVEEGLSGCDLSADQAEFSRRFNRLAAALGEFVAQHHGLTWTTARTKDLLLDYADRFSSDVLAAAMDGKPIPATPPHQVEEKLFVVHEFVLASAREHPTEFDLLVSLVKARMLSDSLYLDIGQGQEAALSDVEVYLDGPILLYVLGNGGQEIQAPYLELLEMLREQGARVLCFHHSLEEAQTILDVAARRKAVSISGQQYHGDVVGYLVRSDRTRAQIELQTENLKRDLEGIGVMEVDTPDRIVELQPDEDELEELIHKYIPNIKRTALDRDVRSLVSVHNLRRGKTPRTVSSCRAVLVTHNYALFKASARFFNQRRSGRSVPHCVYDATFTTLIWLHQPKRYPDLPREAVLAGASAALQPSDQLWREYNNAVQKQLESGALTDDDARFLRYSEDAKTLLMDLTRGNPDNFSDGTLKELLVLYGERKASEERERTSDARSQLDTERSAHRATAELIEQQRQQSLDTRVRAGLLARQTALRVANTAYGLMILLLATALIFVPVGPIDTHLPSMVRWMLGGLAVGVGVWTTATGGAFRHIRDRIADRLSGIFEGFLLRRLGIEARDDQREDAGFHAR